MTALAAEFAAHLTRDRRRSAHTVRAYAATAERLVGFLGEHWGAVVDRAALTRIRGRKIGLVPQDPLTSLNPLFTVGQQLAQTIQARVLAEKGID